MGEGRRLMIPHGNNPGLISFDGDFIMFAYVLAFGKFLMIISALDTGSSFEGMGASREALFSMLVEPAFFILLGSFALLRRACCVADIRKRPRSASCRPGAASAPPGQGIFR